MGGAGLGGLRSWPTAGRAAATARDRRGSLVAGPPQPQAVLELRRSVEEVGVEDADVSDGAHPVGGVDVGGDVVDGDGCGGDLFVGDASESSGAPVVAGADGADGADAGVGGVLLDGEAEELFEHVGAHLGAVVVESGDPVVVGGAGEEVAHAEGGAAGGAEVLRGADVLHRLAVTGEVGDEVLDIVAALVVDHDDQVGASGLGQRQCQRPRHRRPSERHDHTPRSRCDALGRAACYVSHRASAPRRAAKKSSPRTISISKSCVASMNARVQPGRNRSCSSATTASTFGIHDADERRTSSSPPSMSSLSRPMRSMS